MTTLEEIYPPFAVKLTLGDLELRVMRDEDIPPLVDVMKAGVQRPGTPQPFNMPWHLAPQDQLGPNAAAWYWSKRNPIAKDNWTLLFVVRHRGQVVGVQDIMCKQNFALARHLDTGSWIGTVYQGQGIGTLMRQAVAMLAFDHLGATMLHSGAFVDNAASIGVSRKVGYVPNGSTWIVDQGVVREQARFILTPDALNRPEQELHVAGAAELRHWLGLEVGLGIGLGVDAG